MNKYRPQTLLQKFGWLVEECGEVQAAVGKTLRWGIHSVNPELPKEEQETNGAWVIRELHDLERAIKLVRAELQDRMFRGSRSLVAEIPPLDVIRTYREHTLMHTLIREHIAGLPAPAAAEWQKALDRILLEEIHEEEVSTGD